MIKHLSRALAALLLVLPLSRAADSTAEPRPFSHPDRIHYDSRCFTIDGKDIFLFSGAFHYFRCPKELWAQRFQTIKDAGFNTVETYVAWNYHENEMPSSPGDFSKVTGLSDLDEWLTMAEKFGLYVIIRPGPYICAEWDNGGFPSWLTALKKPATPLRKEAWLRTDDPVYLTWCKHWLDAVCPTIARHQITQKAPGQPGVILFQIENEYDYAKFPNEVKVNCLTALINDVQADGIDVPLFTCFTSQSHGVTSGPLRAVFDCTNTYPRWKIGKETGSLIRKSRAAQPDAPQATTELQAGWFAQVGKKLSEQQDGITAAQIQNITLFAWQLGDTLTNYYMLFGGTNFDDWAARDLITSYDYAAPIREDGGLGERYQRVWSLGHMLRDHGAKLARSEAVEVSSTISDKDVEIAERKARDGSRYLFVRTENHEQPRAGSATVKESDGTQFTFDYKLEPFGSVVLYLPPNVTDAKQGEWLPKPAPAISHIANAPAAIDVHDAEMFSDAIHPASEGYVKLKKSEPPENRRIFGSHFLYYTFDTKPGATVTVQVQPGDSIIASAAGKLLPSSGDTRKGSFTFSDPKNTGEFLMLYEDAGHPNFGLTVGQPNGILSIQSSQGNDSDALSLLIDSHGNDRILGQILSAPAPQLSSTNWKPATIGASPSSISDSLLTWYRMTFALPNQQPSTFQPWHIHLAASGNGFIYVNGHPIGRYWQAGPQHDFYIPEPWLNFGPDKTNVVALDLRPVDRGTGIQAASVVPDPAFVFDPQVAANAAK